MKLHVGNLTKEVTEAQLDELARPYGVIESVEIVKDRPSGVSRGYGFLVFKDVDEAKAAVSALHGAELNGKMLRVSDARAPKDKARLIL